MGLWGRMADALFPPPAKASLEIIEGKAALGPGAAVMEYGSAWLHDGTQRQDSPRWLAKAQALSHANPWIEKAERMISGRAASLPWHLEDGDDTTVDDESDPDLLKVAALLERPNP